MQRTIPMPSDRSFGLTFTAVFAIIGLVLAWKSNGWWPVFFSAAALLSLLSFLAPSALRPFKVAWMHFGEVLHAIVNPIVLGLLYFGLFTPIACFFRVRGRDALRRKLDPAAGSYWINREPPGPDAQRSFPRQF